VYTVRFSRAVYVLHCFQKSPRGIKTARSDIGVVQKRLRTAQADYEARYAKGTK
jgi:phage-related protein